MESLKPSPPQERSETIRRAILRHLEEGDLTARDLSGLVGVREKDIVAHLEHIQKSLRRTGRRMIIVPAECQACGYVFDKRTRLTRPGACPKCRATRVDSPVFGLGDNKRDR